MSFRPLPLLSNPHVQTILGAFFNGDRANLRARRHIIPLADGDRVVLHETFVPGTANGRAKPQAAPEPLALLVHGLGGSHRSAYMERITRRLSERGWRVFRMDLRGAGAGTRLARRCYSAACSDDVRTVVVHLSQAFPASPISVIGFSLGGNIVLKFAGKRGRIRCPLCAQLPQWGRRLTWGGARSKSPATRGTIHFSRYLRRQVERHQRFFPDVPKIDFPVRLRLRQFDDLYTAPRWGYADALDYYRQASAFSRIAAIGVPTYILTARDDPLVAVAPFEELPASPKVEVHIAAHGGHLGFLGLDETGGIRWAETQIVNWLLKEAAACGLARQAASGGRAKLNNQMS